jgi:hypothetical protein
MARRRSYTHTSQPTDMVQMSRFERDSLEMSGVKVLALRMEIAKLKAKLDAPAVEVIDKSVPPGCLLPRDVAKLMHQYGWTTVRQSNLADLRECSQRLRFWGDGVQGTNRRPFYFLFGTLYHALDEAGMVDASASDIEDLLQVLAAREPAGWHDGRVNIDDAWLKRAALAMTKPETFGGMSINDILKETRELIDRLGIRIVRREVFIQMQDTDGILFTLQIDALAQGRRGNRIDNITLDTKTAGMSKSVVAAVHGERKAVDGVVVTPDDMMWNLQLRHYSWSAKRAAAMNGKEFITHRVGQIHPANATRYLQGPKKGMQRGPILMLSELLPIEFEEAYERAMVDSISAIVRGGPHRHFPNNFGDSKCNDCPFVKPCLRTGDTRFDVAADTSKQLSEMLIKSGNFDFLTNQTTTK